MLRAIIGAWLLLTLLVYVVAVFAFGFAGPVALTIHFSRIALTTSALIIYARMLPDIFSEVPTPRRDYLLAGIVFMMLSSVCFSFWNEAGRIFGVDTSIFTNAIAGLFSLFLIVGAGFVLIAPDVAGRKSRWLALAVGILIAVWLVFIAPYFAGE